MNRFLFGAFFLVFMACSTGVQAQVIMSLIFGDKLNNEHNLFGIHLDYSSNSLTGLEASDPMRSFNLGLFYTHKWTSNWHLNIDLMAKYQRGASGIPSYDLGDPGLNTYYADAEVLRKINYFSVPATLRYAYQGVFFIELGPQFSFRTKARDIFEVDLPQGDLELDVDIRDQIQRFDVGYVSGVGMYIDKERVNALGIRFQGGFSDITEQLDGSQRHQQFTIYVNLPIGRGKMKSQ